jgi:hypothetical protein
MADKFIAPLPPTTEERAASSAQPLPPGVLLVRTSKRVTGLHVHPGGVALLRSPSWPWEPQQPLTKVSRGLIRSRVKLHFADGTKLTVRPYKPGIKCLADVGQSDTTFIPTTTGTRGAGASDIDSIIVVLVILAAIILFPVAFVFLGRELFGTSARARQATILVDQLRPLTVTKSG